MNCYFCHKELDIALCNACRVELEARTSMKCTHQNNLKNDHFLDCPKCNPEVKSA